MLYVNSGVFQFKKEFNDFFSFWGKESPQELLSENADFGGIKFSLENDFPY